MISVVGEGCFLYICFSAPVAGAYKTKVALHRTDHPAGTEYTNLQADRYANAVLNKLRTPFSRYTAVKYNDMVASAEMLDSGVGCKMQYLYRLAIQQNMDTTNNTKDTNNRESATKPSPSVTSVMPPPPPPILPPGPPVQDAGPFKDLSSAQPSKDSLAVEIPSLPQQPAVTPPPPPPALPPPAPPAPSSNVTGRSTDLPTRHSQPSLHESIQSQILNGVKLKSVSANPAKEKIAEKRSLEEILSSVIDQRRSMMDSDSE